MRGWTKDFVRSVKDILNTLKMSDRRSRSVSPDPRAPKRQKIGHLTKEDFKNGIFLAPMVRSGALPTRLFALKHGATLVWGPEIVDKAILHAKREVDPVTGVVSYNGVSRAIFTTHPIEKPYLIYQIGSADPELAVQAAKTVQQDVSGIDLNCGCPKPFSTHAGMGAALLTNPDLLISILEALRKAMPPEITVTAKIRLLPSQEDTLKLVERIVNTGVSALTVHCRTRNMREKDRAVIERLNEIVEFVEKMGKGIAVIENGDCLDWEDAKRVRRVTGAHSVMIARGAEANPSCFSEKPLVDVERTLWPSYFRLCKYLGHHWGLTKYCIAQFRSTRVEVTKAEAADIRQRLSQAKDYDNMTDFVKEWTGEEEMKEIVDAINNNCPRQRRMLPSSFALSPEEAEKFVTPSATQNPEPPTSGAPLLPSNIERDASNFPPPPALTPTPSSAIPSAPLSV
ncbi:tRNA-dihydrouridine synthase 2 [Coprinopsis cinerea okayama7|uniref:tRNA-dihydrouridine synthase 2 n=1 Tax=Coprinopsis cinerea (strain Okayama-7 / 130 / ATCC MYA-4618 / FGSC 9003) TaxID=240176 RepID=A8N3D2_COPC7|nr:tRNA-dihydrouridine synthase 2 [Coprinopsis cinerea okayama7\|eukprot:XP_001829377.1 tRNA-dihydrouridine synthase 2 [Coprinopsis cinerea okayama7\